jgi:CysZ protein
MSTAHAPGVIGRFVGGLFAPLRGLRFLLAHPRLLAYAAFPTFINIVLVLAIFFVGMHFSESLADRIIPAGDQWYWTVLSYAIQIVLVVMLVLFGALVFYILAGIICVPFNEVLSQKTERIFEGARREEPFSLRLLSKDIAISLKNEIKRTAVMLLLLLFLIVVFLIPVIGKPFYLVFGNIITMFFLAYDNLDYPLARRRLPFAAKCRFIFRHSASCLGFGAGALVSVVIPFLNFVIIPLTVVGATILFCEIETWYGKVPDMTPAIAAKRERSHP